MTGLWFLVGLALAMGAVSLFGDRSRRRYVRARMAASPAAFPPATVIVPVKGDDDGLAENLAALAAQEYPDYELIVTARLRSDIPAGTLPEQARLVPAGDGDPATGEKINNLVAAVASARPQSEIFAFADSDGRPGIEWLKALVAGLEQENAGASTGYRVYLPRDGGFWALSRSVWNAVIGGGFGPGNNRFAWGGGMAIRKDVFHQVKVLEHWRGAVSDDYALSAAVHRAGLRIVYEPVAQVVSAGGTGRSEFLRWIQRQMVITKVYAPKLWFLALLAHLIYCGALIVSLAIALQGNLIGVYTLCAQLLLGFWKGANRLRIMRLSLPRERGWLRRLGWVHIWLVPWGTCLWLYGLAASAVTNVIEWRGNRYRLSATSVEKL